MERVLSCRKRLGSTTDSSVEQRLEGGRCADPELNQFVGNGGLGRPVGSVLAGRTRASCAWISGSLSQGMQTVRSRVTLASTPVRTEVVAARLELL